MTLRLPIFSALVALFVAATAVSPRAQVAAPAAPAIQRDLALLSQPR